MTDNAVTTNIRNGIIGSLAGGIVFGMVMAMMGMMAMVANLVGSESVGVGWAVHLVISLIFGVAFGGILHAVDWNRIVAGMMWGVAAWIGGGLIIMPLMLGMSVFPLGASAAWFSLLGHLMYGVVAGLVVWGIERRTSAGVPQKSVTQ